ncbi:TauD/TfdA dioxygenase family protein [Saccharopolyspora griseoalba]|uniref:TauD/TfdA dioxygenase family protein n=1 Tax=Saccharopolyspora griseoalba TaxID=1431848 RepID=A0ABW2LR76_9PSEU
MKLSCTRLTPALGATATLPLGDGDVTDEIADVVHSALMEHSVLVFPNSGLDAKRLVQLGEALGTLGARHHSYTTHPDFEDVVVLAWGGEDAPDAAEWHSDMTYRGQPPFASILKAVEVPPVGGDTLWASTFAVHDALDPGLRRDLEQLEAVHDMGAFRTGAYRSGGNEGICEAFAQAGTAVHPIIAHHPVTGRPYVNVSESFTRFVIGLSAPESARILTYLFDLINRPDFHVRIKWEPGTVVIWDNRGTQHYAVADYLPDRRVMHRVAVTTDKRTPTANGE